MSKSKRSDESKEMIRSASIDFESAKAIVEKYRPSGIMEREDALKIMEYCKEIGCEKCELSKHYGKCPIVISL